MADAVVRVTREAFEDADRHVGFTHDERGGVVVHEPRDGPRGRAGVCGGKQRQREVVFVGELGEDKRRRVGMPRDRFEDVEARGLRELFENARRRGWVGGLPHVEVGRHAFTVRAARVTE